MEYLYALMKNDVIKKVPIEDSLRREVRNMFFKYARDFMPSGIEKKEFSSDYIVRKEEEITYVNYSLPCSFNDIEKNQADIPEYRVGVDENPRSIFWYDHGKCFFQIFNKSNMLDRRFILGYSLENKYTKLIANAFIIDDKIQALYEDGKLFFYSIISANLIFHLMDYVKEATEEDIEEFGRADGINVDINRVKNIANTKTRRLVTLVIKSGNINIFRAKSREEKNKILNDYQINATLDDNGNLILPVNNAASLNCVLQFLNEDIFKGAISKRTYMTNSKIKNS